MATYKNRRQMNSETELSRYMPLIALENMRRKKQRRLIRVDMFQDPFEGSEKTDRWPAACLQQLERDADGRVHDCSVSRRGVAAYLKKASSRFRIAIGDFVNDLRIGFLGLGNVGGKLAGS